LPARFPAFNGILDMAAPRELACDKLGQGINGGNERHSALTLQRLPAAFQHGFISDDAGAIDLSASFKV
jgi:hypothetical protein